MNSSFFFFYCSENGLSLRFCEELSTRARDNTQLLFNKIWELEKKRVDEAIVAVLPKAVYRLPREKKVIHWEFLSLFAEKALFPVLVRQRQSYLLGRAKLSVRLLSLRSV